jgi:hypothetical protein
MTVRIRLEAANQALLDIVEVALRGAINVTSGPSRDYPNRRTSGLRRYLSADVSAATRQPVQSPLAAAEEHKRRRDIAGEIGALMSADAELKARPWYPIRPGDVVLMRLAGAAGVPAYGETFLAVDTDMDGCAMLRQVSRDLGHILDGPNEETHTLDDALVSFYELWFEAGPSVLTVIRAGAVVHGTPAA